jgi:hypothetical protein
MQSLPLFDSIPPELTRPPTPSRESLKAEGKRKGDLAYAATADAWKEAIYKIAVTEFLPRRYESFIFEDFTKY